SRGAAARLEAAGVSGEELPDVLPADAFLGRPGLPVLQHPILGEEGGHLVQPSGVAVQVVARDAVTDALAGSALLQVHARPPSADPCRAAGQDDLVLASAHAESQEVRRRLPYVDVQLVARPDGGGEPGLHRGEPRRVAARCLEDRTTSKAEGA